VGRRRRLELSPTTFRWLSWGTLVSLLFIITSGAVVRLTASGLGCDNWPRCGNTPFPEQNFHAVVEFSNRALGLIPITLSLLLWLGARRTRGLSRWVVWLAFGIFLGTIAQAPLGGLTVLLDLNPLLVMSHFLLAMLVLGVAVVVAVEAWSNERGRSEPVVPVFVQLAAAIVAVSALAAVVTGAFVTAAGPHSGGSDIERLGSPLTATWVHVRATAVFGIAFLCVLGYLLLNRRRHVVLFGTTLGVLALVLAQVAVGEIQYRTQLPWGLVLVHVTLAAATWAGSLLLAALLFRPPLPVAKRAQTAETVVTPAAEPTGHEIGTVS
jgi:heme a synthase